VRRTLVLALLFGLIAPGLPARAHTGGTVTGFENPESAPWDGATGSFYVSNMGPGPIDPNGREPDGYISKLSGEGRMVAAKWVTGLRSPKGIHRRGDDLLVADVGQVVVIDVAGAKIRETIDLDAIASKGYAFQIETTYRAARAGFRVVEIPIHFVDREEGGSKMSRAIVAEAIWKVPALRLAGLRGRL